MIEILESFQRNWKLHEVSEITGDARLFYYPPGSWEGASGHGEAKLFSVVPSFGEPWYLSHAPDPGLDGLSFVSATPDADWICTCVSGLPFLVRQDGSEWNGVSVLPVSHVIATKEPDLLVLADETRLIAVGLSGSKEWDVEASLEGFDDLRFCEGAISGLAYRDNLINKERFRIAIMSGELRWSLE